MANKKINKAFEMTDAKIAFVSLVNKAANKRHFLVTKAENGNASFQTYGKIIKADSQSHLVTGIVYEPMTEDTDGNFMTEEEITKAAHWFAKNGTGVDLQHNFESLDGACVVESSVTKCDMEIDGQPIKKGTWIMTVEITNDDIYEAIEKGDITGFSMGGVGMYSDQDVDISGEEPEPVTKQDKKGILKSIAKLLGIADDEPIVKGEVLDKYKAQSKRENFWNAFYALQETLMKWDWREEKNVFCGDEETVKEALTDFNSIVTDLLVEPDGVWKCVKEGPVEKAGKTLSTKNLEQLKSIHDSLGTFLANNNSEKEEEEVTKEQAQSIAVEAATAAIEKAFGGLEKPETTPKAEEGVQKQEKPADTGITAEKLDEMIQKAIQKAMGEEPPVEEEKLTLEEMVEKAVEKAMQPYLEEERDPSGINGEGIQKSGADDEAHYLHGIL